MFDRCGAVDCVGSMLDPIAKFDPLGNLVVRFEGKLIAAWGKRGSGPGEFALPHALAMDSAGRLFVADRGNNRIEIFDQAGKFIAEWKQFGRPSGLFIDKNDILYYCGCQSRLQAWADDRQRQGRNGDYLHSRAVLIPTP